MNLHDVRGDPFELVPDYDLESGVEQSLFVLAVELFRRRRPDKQGLEALVNAKKSIFARSIFRLRDKELLALGSALGLSGDPRLLAAAACRDLVSQDEAPKYLSEALRFCESCLRRGWHSALFQHWAVPMCPVHLERLRSGCPACGTQIATDMYSLARSQMTCDSCGVLFARQSSLPTQRDNFDCLPSKLFAAQRRALPPRFARRVGDAPRLLSTTDARTTVFAHDAHLHRFQVWPDSPLPGYRFRKGLEFRYARDQLSIPVVDEAIVEKQMVETLTEIEAALIDADCMAPCPPQLVRDSHQGARFDGTCTVGAAAYWKTAHIYRLAKHMAQRTGSPPPRISHYGYGCFTCPAAWKDMLRLEVLGMMAKCLISVHTLRCLVQVEWESVPPNATFLPAWRLFEHDSYWLVQARPVADMASLRKMLRRYGGRRLWEIPDDGVLSRHSARVS